MHHLNTALLFVISTGLFGGVIVDIFDDQVVLQPDAQEAVV